MWTMLKLLLAQWALRRLVVRSFASLLVLLPAGLLLKGFGLPLLAMLGTLAAPLLLGLFVIGLPVILVLLVGGALLAITGALITAGFAVLKVALLIGMPVAIVVWMVRRRSCRPRPSTGAAEPPPRTEQAGQPATSCMPTERAHDS